MASNKKDMRRQDLIVPYIEPVNDKENQDFNSTMTSTLPMAAMFTRNKLLAWTSVLFAVQSWLGESSSQKSSGGTPAIMSLGIAFTAVAVSYMSLFLPPPPGGSIVPGGSTTGAAAPAAAE
ncbi:uncharacterized protein K489DRAFT_378454 [Dissoconium aciculare CBS 342.82]|uniref:Uncharacterized protein n=1 Tax=Dissoconium aciculare CBS 342.82 TaxID=1314786 RepID=A0A6J3M872_9PEZI|nr:uncharacterized protein K489DRAFT_378454 [Dissoconium aciculare CBS 342.82]KAF1824063.1 hypothetical protein K489DRAFT_378454 [Dissoconium aciculare CBS 342.82]